MDSKPLPSGNAEQHPADFSEREEADGKPQTPQSTTSKLLSYVLQRRRTKVVFILGLMRCGKSSLFEALTGKKGYSGHGIDSVTQEYQLGCGRINGEFYIFIDTPGFDDPKTTNEAMFRHIVSLIQLIQDYAIFAGILYVHQVDSVCSAGQSIFIDWLTAVCGPLYAKYVTFVTTKWDAIHPKLLHQASEQLDEWTTKWDNFLKHGAKMYHHGKKYNSNGVDLGIILDDKKDEKARREQARSMITRHYKGKETLYPQLVVELRRGVAIEKTSAGQSLSMQPEKSEDPASKVNVNWFTMLVDLLLQPMTALTGFVSKLMKFLPDATWRQKIAKKGFEIIITLRSGTEIAVGWGKRGLYLDCPPDDSDGENDEFEISDEWDGNEEELLSSFGDTPDERLLAKAMRRAMEERTEGTCVVM